VGRIELKPTVTIDTAQTPGGSELVLYQHDDSFFIRVDGEILMHSRQHESELELARLGCAHLAEEPEPAVLIGGLGLGYTLRQCLDMLNPKAVVTLCELMPAVIEWNREYLGVLAGYPLSDKRVRVKQVDVVKHLARNEGAFDAILLDVDNGPSAMTDAANSRLYGRRGIQTCSRALKPRGCLAVWSAEASKPYEQALVRAGLAVRRYRVPAYKGGKAQSRFIWVASRDAAQLPSGGGEPKPPPRKRRRQQGETRRPSRRRNSGR
jgi:spermidine synthase